MSHHRVATKSRFFLTAPQPCPYLTGRVERKLFTKLKGEDAALINDELSLMGFRRSQSVAYRPACPDCAACLSTRIPVARFLPSDSQKRVGPVYRSGKQISSGIDHMTAKDSLPFHFRQHIRFGNSDAITCSFRNA